MKTTHKNVVVITETNMYLDSLKFSGKDLVKKP